MFVRTTAINKLLKLKARKRVIQGGTSAGKTYGIIPCLINTATLSPRKRITVVAESVPALRDGAVRIFQDIMFETARWVQTRWNTTLMEYTFSNGCKIQFKSFDSVGKAKASGKREILFINEANHIDFEIADALMTRTTDAIWIDFNPDNEFWAHTEVLTEPNSEFLLLSYMDNEALPPEIYEELMIKLSKAYCVPPKTLDDKFWEEKENIKSEYWANWCKVYIKGEIGNLQGCVFQNWKEGEFNTSLPFIYGQDYGFEDPDTLLKVAIDNSRKLIYADELMYQNNQSTPALLAKMDELLPDKKRLIVADCAQPRTIDDIAAEGFNIVPATKGPDSVLNGIKKIQEYTIIVSPRSHNLKKELRHYMWHDKKSETPIDAWNHLIDPLRYAFDELEQPAFYFK